MELRRLSQVRPDIWGSLFPSARRFVVLRGLGVVVVNGSRFGFSFSFFGCGVCLFCVCAPEVRVFFFGKWNAQAFPFGPGGVGAPLSQLFVYSRGFLPVLHHQAFGGSGGVGV